MNRPGSRFQIFDQAVTFLLITLWVYAAISKMLEYAHFRNEMANQEFPKTIGRLLAVLLPPVELTTALLLVFNKTKNAGLLSSLILLAAFTLYTALVLIGFYGHTPCSCGGILEKLSWSGHFAFNIFFLTITIFSFTLKGRSFLTKNGQHKGRAI